MSRLKPEQLTLIEMVDRMRGIVIFFDGQGKNITTTGGGKCTWMPEVKQVAAARNINLPSPPAVIGRFGSLAIFFETCRAFNAGTMTTEQIMERVKSAPFPTPGSTNVSGKTEKELIEDLARFVTATGGHFPAQDGGSAWTAWTQDVMRRQGVGLAGYAEYRRRFGTFEEAKEKARAKLMEQQHQQLAHIDVVATPVVAEVMGYTDSVALAATAGREANIPKDVAQAAHGLIEQNHKLEALIDEMQLMIDNQEAQIRQLQLYHPVHLDALSTAALKTVWENRHLVQPSTDRGNSVFLSYLNTLAVAAGLEA